MSASEQITMEDEGGLSNDTNLRSPEEEAYQSLILLQQIHIEYFSDVQSQNNILFAAATFPA